MERERILIVDDVPANIKVLAESLRDAYRLAVATNGEEALGVALHEPHPDLILLDIMMPGMNGYQVLERLRADERGRGIPVIFLTAMGEVQNEAKGLALGAVDYIVKPFHPAILQARVKTQLELKRHRHELETLVAARTRALREALASLDAAHARLKESHIDSIYRLTKASEYKDPETGFHIRRTSYYTRELARVLGQDEDFQDLIFHAAPMHDIGKVAIPDAILLKPGGLTAEEFSVMKQHTLHGGRILEGSTSRYLQAAREIALSHHERWDGTGYPRGLRGEEIPLAARIMNISDQYDALRSNRPYKPGFDHDRTLAILRDGDGRTAPSHFDPRVHAAFLDAAETFRAIFTEHAEEETRQ